MAVKDISRDDWRDELDSFSRQHEGWLVSVTMRHPGADVAVAAHDVPLHGVSPASSDSHDIAVIVGDDGNHLTHQVHEPVALQIELTANQAERALIIRDAAGTITTVEFRSPMRPEDVDGLPFRARS